MNKSPFRPELAVYRKGENGVNRHPSPADRRPSWDERFGLPVPERRIPTYSNPPVRPKSAMSNRVAPSRPASALSRWTEGADGWSSSRPKQGGITNDWEFRTHPTSRADHRAWPEYDPETSAAVGRRWLGHTVGDMDVSLPKISSALEKRDRPSAAPLKPHVSPKDARMNLHALQVCCM